ncbi:MAG: hypothetical protein WBD03_04950 [Thermoplasmata archaeon]
MSKSKTEAISVEGDAFGKVVKTDGAEAARLFLLGMLIWLFSVLVFIPLSASTGEAIRLVVTLILVSAFTITVYRIVPILLRLIDSLSVPLARKKRFRRRMDEDDAETFVRTVLYMAAGSMIYLLYVPFLLWLHPAFAGIGLICLIIWIALLFLRIMSAVGRDIMQWIYSE